jgi:phosphonatase-like hydrolase
VNPVPGIELVVFDMAGTTVDEGNVVYQTLLRAIVAAGFPCTLDEVLARGVGKEKLQSIRDVLAAAGRSTSPGQLEEIHRHFQGMLTEAYANLDVRPQPNAAAVFQALKGRDIAVALNTGYNQTIAESLLKRLGWSVGREVAALVTASQVRNCRPRPDMIRLAQVRLGISDPRAVVKVGDTTFDVEEGRNAGCGLCIAVTTGAHTRAQLALAQPDAIIDDLEELLELIEPNVNWQEPAAATPRPG